MCSNYHIEGIFTKEENSAEAAYSINTLPDLFLPRYKRSGRKLLVYPGRIILAMTIMVVLIIVTLKMWLCHACCFGVGGWTSCKGCSQAW